MNKQDTELIFANKQVREDFNFCLRHNIMAPIIAMDKMGLVKVMVNKKDAELHKKMVQSN